MQPGQTITPSGTEEPQWQYKPESQPQPAVPQPQPQYAPAPNDFANQPAGYAQPQAAPLNGVSWSASEYIAHAKNSGWYVMLMLITVLATVGIYFLARDIVTTVAVGIVGILFGISAGRKPRVLQYTVDNHGIVIGIKEYPYSSFRTFSIVDEDGIDSIWLMPLKRFMPIVSIYFEAADGDRIVDVLSQYLPVEDRQPDPVDRLMHKIRF